MENWELQRNKILGLGERSLRKSYYPELQKRLNELALFRNLLDNSSDAVFLFSLPSGALVDCNQTACKYIGPLRKEKEERNLEDILDLTSANGIASLLKGNLPASYSQNPYRASLKSTSGHVPIEITIGFYDTNDVKYCIVITRDISERLRQEEAQVAFDRQLQHTQRLESLGVLAGGIAHDFNNLLMGVLGHLDLVMCDLPQNSPLYHHVHSSQATALKIADLVKQLLAYAGKGQFCVEPVDLSASVEEMIDLLKVAISKKIALQLDLDANIPTIDIDSRQLQQVILNLVTNASDSIDDNPGAIAVKTGIQNMDSIPTAEIVYSEIEKNSDCVYLEVRDTGHGIDDQTKQRMFDPFYSTKLIGRGLGLSVVIGIVKAHNGALTLRSEPNKGATFKIIFPCSKIKSSFNQDALRSINDIICHDGGTILLVDDDAAVLNVAKQMLVHLGYDVVTAENGEQAVRLIESQTGGFKAVILDRTMPKMGGLEALSAIRNIDNSVPIVLASGYSEDDAYSGENKRMLSAYIQKPYTLRALSEAICSVLGKTC
jgi:PAS domain S-box-containing protein